jgi:3-hydroxyisobutyrate dehydrogenase
MDKPNIAFLGLGIMGSGMARRLLETGHAVTVYNRDARKSTPLAAAGARVATTPGLAAKGADVIISMVADDQASRSLWLEADGALAGLKPGALCLESSTLSVAWVQELATAVVAKGGEFLDCPVTGSKAQAGAGELKFLVGGTSSTLERARPVLMALSTEIVHLGGTGSGVLLKLVNNSLNGVQVAALAEAILAIERSGIDTAKAIAVITNGASGSPMVKAVSARISARDYTPQFHLHLLAKDLTYVVNEGDRCQVAMTMAAAAGKLLLAANAAGYGNQDMAALIESFRKNGNGTHRT